MAESQSAEEKVMSAFMGDLEPENQPANPEAGATEVEGAVAPEVEQQVEEVEASTPETPEDVQTIEIDPEEPLFEQELTEEDGKKVAQKLSLKELQQGYLRERDYRKKTQELARQREELPKLVAKQGQELSESYTKRLAELQGVVAKTVAAELSGVDLNKLATEDPFEYIRISNRAKQLNELLQSVQQEQESIAAKRKQEEEQSKREQWQQSLEILNKDIPGFGEPVVKRLLDAGEEWGFSKDEVAQWTDHRIIKMLHALSDKKTVETKRPEIEKKVAVVTKTLKPGQSSKPSNKIQEARTKLRKSGRPEDALSIFEAML